jgi:hypothetical protein
MYRPSLFLLSGGCVLGGGCAACRRKGECSCAVAVEALPRNPVTSSGGNCYNLWDGKKTALDETHA